MRLQETAKMNGLDPHTWLTDVLQRLPGWPEIAGRIVAAAGFRLRGQRCLTNTSRENLRLTPSDLSICVHRKHTPRPDQKSVNRGWPGVRAPIIIHHLKGDIGMRSTLGHCAHGKPCHLRRGLRRKIIGSCLSPQSDNTPPAAIQTTLNRGSPIFLSLNKLTGCPPFDVSHRERISVPAERAPRCETANMLASG
jgi:hypothetical protein